MAGNQKEEAFELSVEYKGQEWILPARLVQMGYTWKIFIVVDGQGFIFEPDEERNFRAVIEDRSSAADVPIGLIEAIVSTLQYHFK